MRVLAEYKYGAGVTITTPSISIYTASSNYAQQEITLRQDVVSYSASLDDSGLLLQDEPQLQLTYIL